MCLGEAKEVGKRGRMINTPCTYCAYHASIVVKCLYKRLTKILIKETVTKSRLQKGKPTF